VSIDTAEEFCAEDREKTPEIFYKSLGGLTYRAKRRCCVIQKPSHLSDGEDIITIESTEKEKEFP